MQRERFEDLVTGRSSSLLQDEIASNLPELSARLFASRVLVIGAAGSIGAALVKQLVAFPIRGLALVDLDENGLAEVVRDLHSSAGVVLPDDFTTSPIGIGSREFERFTSERAVFDYVFNLCAIKHVRSEKDVCGLMRMIDTNVVFVHRLLESETLRPRNFFSVSSDKAVNPTSLMGASKCLMERVLLHHSTRRHVSCARFANVAFSNGSLPHAVLRRIEKRQPIAAPRDVRRYFISHQEAGQLCLLAGVLGENADCFFPKLERLTHEGEFDDIVRKILSHLGYEAVECASEEEAKTRAEEWIPQRRWPCFFTTADTAGEKPFEELHGEEEIVDTGRYRTIGVVKGTARPDDSAAVDAFLSFAGRLSRDLTLTRRDVAEAFRRAVPSLSHLDRDESLDGRM